MYGSDLSHPVSDAQCRRGLNKAYTTPEMVCSQQGVINQTRTFVCLC